MHQPLEPFLFGDRLGDPFLDPLDAGRTLARNAGRIARNGQGLRPRLPCGVRVVVDIDQRRAAAKRLHRCQRLLEWIRID